MNILFVSMLPFENNTSATIQNYGIVRGLVEANCKVDIITLKPDESAVNYDKTMNDISSLVDNVYYLPINPRYKAIMAKKIKQDTYETNRLKKIAMISRKKCKEIYNKFSVFDAQKINVRGIDSIKINYNKYDIIISASDPKSSHLIVSYIKNKYKNLKFKWIQYWGDPMLHDITRKNNYNNFLVKNRENKILGEADKIIYASPITLAKQKDSFKNHANKMDYANQVYSYNEENKPMKINDNLKNIKFGYYGSYKSTIRNIIPLYDSAKEKNINLNICGYSDIELKEVNNIKIEKFVPYNKVLDMEKETDILICLCNSRGTQIPGKIYYCSGYKKPIIVILDGEYTKDLNKYLSTFGRFILCENNKASISDAIDRAIRSLDTNKYSLAKELTPKYMAMKILEGIET